MAWRSRLRVFQLRPKLKESESKSRMWSRPSQEIMLGRGRIFIVSAPSGSGKSTLVTQLLEKVPDLDFSISYTTRKPRGNEKNGVEYFFVTEAVFDEMLAGGQFVEHAQVFDHSYGTARHDLEEA